MEVSLAYLAFTSGSQAVTDGFSYSGISYFKPSWCLALSMGIIQDSM